MLVSKTREKTREKHKKNARKIKNASPTQDNVSILHYALGKNASQLRFGCVLVVFWSRFGHKHCQNANPTHSVIGPIEYNALVKPMFYHIFSYSPFSKG